MKPLRWVAGVVMFVLFQLVWTPAGSVSPASAQTFTCTGADVPTNSTIVAFDSSTNTCTITNGGALPTTANTLFFQTRPANIPDAFVSALGTGGATVDNDSLNVGGFAGASIGTFLIVNNDFPDGGITATATQTFAVGLCTMNIAMTRAGAASLDVTAASVTCQSAGPNAQDKSNTVAALQGSFNSATPGVLDTLNGAGGNGQGGNGVTFAPTGLGFAQSGIDSANPMDRQFGSAFAPKGYFDGGQKQRSGDGFNFSVNLNKLPYSAANDNDAGVLGYGTGGAKDGAPRPQSRITSFVTGQYVDFDDGETNADRDGHLWVVTSGLGLRVSQNTTVGLLSRYRSGEADSTALNASLDSDFYGGGAFLTATLGGGLKVAVAGLYEMGDNDIRIGTATGSFDSDHVTLEGRIDKRFERGTFWIEPGVGIRYIDTDQDNYTDSSGTFVTNQDLTLGRLTYGPKIGTTITRGNVTLKPYAKINGVWDFENDGNFATSTAGTFSSADSGINLGGGIDVTYLSGFSIRIASDWTTYDTDLDVWSLSGGIGAPLSALGLGQVGFVSLDLAANAQDASAKARLRIPLGKPE